MKNRKKIIVIGCPGSGKSTLAAALHQKTGIPLFHLDMLYWNADKTTVERTVFLERLSAAMAGDEWIIDGNYVSTMELRLASCDTVIFLDYPTELCLDGIRRRRGKARADMPWIEREEDAEFVEFVKNFREQVRPQILALLAGHRDKTVIVLKNREEADTFLQGTV